MRGEPPMLWGCAQCCIARHYRTCICVSPHLSLHVSAPISPGGHIPRLRSPSMRAGFRVPRALPGLCAAAGTLEP